MEQVVLCKTSCGHVDAGISRHIDIMYTCLHKRRMSINLLCVSLDDQNFKNPFRDECAGNSLTAVTVTIFCIHDGIE